MSHELMIEVLKDLVGVIILGAGKFFIDMRKLREDLDIAFNKIRELESRIK